MTVRRIATEASTTSQTIYTYFGSRDAVIAGMYDRVLEDVDRLLGLLEARVGGLQPDERPEALRMMLSEYRQYCLARPAHFLMLVSGRGPDGTDSEEIRRRRRDLLGLLRACRRADPESPDTGDTTTTVSLAAIDGFIHAELHRLIDEPAQSDRLFGDLVETLSAV